MSIYMTETEQLEEIKKWWVRHQNWISITLSVILLFVAGYRYWNWHSEKIMQQASTAYENMVVASSKHDESSVQSYANQLIKNFEKTVYASAAHLMLAKILVSHEEYQKAQAELSIVAHHAKMDALKQVATVRLARILSAQKHYDEALSELATLTHSIYEPVVNEIKGDIFVAKGEYVNADISYRAAMKDLKQDGVNHVFLKMKHNAVATSLQSHLNKTSASATV